MGFESLEEIKVWQLSRKYFSMIFQLTKKSPFSADFKFRDQIRAAAGSVMDNIAEGFGRGGNKEFLNFLSIAKGSVEETRSQLYRAKDIEYITVDEFNQAITLADTIAKMIASLQSYLKNSEMKGKKFNKAEEEALFYENKSPEIASELRTQNSELSNIVDSEPRTQNPELRTNNID